MSKTFRAWVLGLALVAAFTWISSSWIDRPVALWVSGIFGERQVPVELSDTPILSVALIASFVFVLFGLAAIAGRRFSRLEMMFVLCVVSTLATIVVKDQLKLVFGRTWPASWGPGILSLVQNNVYGFHFFHAGKSFESFPSGHAAVTAAVLSVASVIFGELRSACLACLIAVDIGLVALNLHFVSDVIAGNFVGYSVTLFIAALWRHSIFFNIN